MELERLDVTLSDGRIVYEHLHRYALCREWVDDKRVLDVACGSGYGSRILAERARHVTAVDIDPAAVERATNRFSHPNLTYVCGDALKLPFEDASFEVVVGLEMIEHLTAQARLLREIRRVLVPGGIFIVSTPNKPIYNRYKTPNPFHPAELDRDEFEELLDRFFHNRYLIGTRMALVSLSYEIDGSSPNNDHVTQTYLGEWREGNRPLADVGNIVLDDPEYMLAICSDLPIERGSVSQSLFVSRTDDLWLEHEKIMSWASQLHDEDEKLRADLVAALAHSKQLSDVEGGLRAQLTAAELRADDARRIAEGVHAANLETRGVVDLLRHSTETRLREDAVAAQKRAQLLSRIVSGLIGTQVGDSDEALLEAIVAAREQNVAQRVRLEYLETLDARLQTREIECDQLRERLASLTEEQAVAIEAVRAAANENERKLQQTLDAAQGEIATIHSDLVAQRVALTTTERALAAQQGRKRRRNDARGFIARHAQIQQQLAQAAATVQQTLPPARLYLNWKQRIAPKMGIALRPPTPVFDRDWIERQCPERAPIRWSRYVRDESLHALDPHPLFSVSHYRDQLPADRRSRVQPLLDYLTHGWREGYNPHPYFANDWYLTNYPDVLAAGMNPLEHYLRHGAGEGRWPNPLFDPARYLASNPDVAREGMNPLVHYVAFGVSECRPLPIAGVDVSQAHKNGGIAAARDPMAYLLTERIVLASDEEDNDLATTPSDSALRPDKVTAPLLAGTTTNWPPERLDDYWLPDRMREYLLDTRDEAVLHRYWYYYSVIARYDGRAADFVSSAACSAIVAHCRARAARSLAVPRVSVIVPVFNNIVDTLCCVASLLDDETAIAFEIVVADDGSTDGTDTVIGSIGGCVRYHRQPKNVGFLLNCNTAVPTTRGAIIVLLNNDTIVLPGWLDALVAPFDRFDKVGLVGAKLLNWDGTLQEAGGIFWRDGSAWNFGRDQDPRASQFNYIKEVDYCSGAAIAVPRAIWDQLEGFDTLYLPAYCEDADLAFRVRAIGYRTLYQPLAEIIHHEGRSHGRDTNVGIKAYQVTNLERLRERWRTTLDLDHYPNADNVFRARDRSSAKPHILVVDHYIPQPDQDAGSRSTLQLIQALIAMGLAVTFWPDNLHRDADYIDLLQQAGVEVIYGASYQNRFAAFLDERQGLYDAVFLMRPHIAEKYLDAVLATPGIVRLYYGHDLHFLRMASRTGSEATTAEIEAMRQLELSICRRVDTPFYPSEEEAALLRDEYGIVTARAIPGYCFPVEDSKLARDRILARAGRPTRQLLFVGGFGHPPNSEGILWFVDAVLPQLNRQGLRFRLQIVGSKPPPEVLSLDGDQVEVLGFVSDDELAHLYRQADVAIAPLLHGAGVKGKVIEAMASGVPVVTTPIGAQGLPAPVDRLVGLATDADTFAAEVIRSCEDVARTADRAERALDHVRTCYSNEAIANVFREAMSKVR